MKLFNLYWLLLPFSACFAWIIPPPPTPSGRHLTFKRQRKSWGQGHIIVHSSVLSRNMPLRDGLTGKMLPCLSPVTRWLKALLHTWDGIGDGLILWTSFPPELKAFSGFQLVRAFGSSRNAIHILILNGSFAICLHYPNILFLRVQGISCARNIRCLMPNPVTVASSWIEASNPPNPATADDRDENIAAVVNNSSFQGFSVIDKSPGNICDEGKLAHIKKFHFYSFLGNDSHPDISYSPEHDSIQFYVSIKMFQIRCTPVVTTKIVSWYSIDMVCHSQL